MIWGNNSPFSLKHLAFFRNYQPFTKHKMSGFAACPLLCAALHSAVRQKPLKHILRIPCFPWCRSLLSFPLVAFSDSSPTTAPCLPFCLTNQLELEPRVPVSHVWLHASCYFSNQMRINRWSILLHLCSLLMCCSMEQQWHVHSVGHRGVQSSWWQLP